MKKEKDQQLDKFRDTVDEKIIMKGESVSVRETPLLDVNCHFSQERCLAVPGGHLLQIFYTIDLIMKNHPQGLKVYMEKKIQNDDEDYFLRPNNLRELLLPEHLTPFFMQYLMDLKTHLQIQISQEAVAFLDNADVSIEDISKLSDEELINFKDMVMANKVSKLHRESGEHMDILYDMLLDILARRVLVDNPHIKIDQVVPKIKLVSVPKNAQESQEKGLILMTIPKVEEEQEVRLEDLDDDLEPDDNSQEGTKTKRVKKLVEMDQKDRAIAVHARVNPALTFFLINEYGGRLVREDFIEFINKHHPEFFDDNEDFDLMVKAVNERARQDQEAFIKANTVEYDKPCLVFAKTALNID